MFFFVFETSTNILAPISNKVSFFSLPPLSCFKEFTGNVEENWEYDYANNQWIQLADMPFTRGHASSSTRPISCGYTMSGGSTNEFGKTATVLYYDYSTNTWSTVGNLTSAINTPVCDFVKHTSTGKTWYYCDKGWSGSWRREVVVD
jgi:hypothetical protein